MSNTIDPRLDRQDVFDPEKYVLRWDDQSHKAIMTELQDARREERRIYAPELLDDPVYLRSDMDIAWGRYNGTLQHFVPWLNRLMNYRPLGVVVEIGGGTGSSAAAFAHICERIISYDFDGHSLEFARRRCKALGIGNVEFRCENGVAALSQYTDGIDGVLLFAVLEHMTISERLETLKASWEALRTGGFILIAETPNRLAYQDHHTTGLPFFNLLPVELAAEYVGRTGRTDVKYAVEHARHVGPQAVQDAMIRSGYSGPSYHEFELAFGANYADYLVSRADDPEVFRVHGDFAAEVEALSAYARAKGLQVDPQFWQQYLSLVFRKP